jgi:putative spermidine/putrescine transport system substrate-binding protein
MKSTLKGCAAALSLAALASFASAPAVAKNEISVMSFGGAYQAAWRQGVFEPYAKEKGIKVVEQEYGGEIAKIKAMIESGNVTLDAVDVDAPTLLQGCDEGIYEKLDPAQFGATDDWIKGTISKCGVGTIMYATIVAYDGNKYTKDAPQSVKDFFDLQKFPGKRGMWKNPATSLEFALLADGVAPEKVYDTLSTRAGVDRAFAKLDTIKKNIVWWEAGAQAPQLLASGEVAMTIAWNGRIYNANKEGKNFQIVWNNEILDSNYWVIPKGAKDIPASLAFIKYAVAPENLARVTRYIPYGPVRKSAAQYVEPDIAKILPTSPQNMTGALTLDNGFWADHGDEIRRRFTTWIAN